MIRLPQRETKLLVAVHGWSGALLGLLLYAVIVTGTAAVFAHEITDWSAGNLGPVEPFARPVDAAVRRLIVDTPDTFRDDLDIRPTASGNLGLFFHTHEMVAGQRKERGILYEVAPDGRVIDRREGYRDDIAADDGPGALGHFLVDLHVRLHLPNPYGLILTGVLGLAMLVAAVSGLLMHRHLLTDLFTLRGRGRLVGWRDAHTVAATWTLPHAFVLAFTGAFFSFAGSVGIPLLAKVAFNGDQMAMVEVLVGAPVRPDPHPVAGADLDRVVAEARARTDAQLEALSVDHFGRADARLTTVHEPRDGEMTGARLSYDGSTGAFLGEKPALGTRPSIGGSAVALTGPLHFGSFAGWWSRAVWFALGCASAYVTWSGMALWVRRRAERSGWRALGRVAAWVGGGLPLALASSAAGYFLSLPVAGAATWTPVAFLIAAGLALGPALLLQAERIAPTLFAATGLVLAALPIMRLAGGGPGWSVALGAGQVAVPALDVLVVLGGLVCLIPAIAALRGHRPAKDGVLTLPHPAE